MWIASKRASYTSPRLHSAWSERCSPRRATSKASRGWSSTATARRRRRGRASLAGGNRGLVDVMAPVIIDLPPSKERSASFRRRGRSRRGGGGRESVRALKGRTGVHPVARRRGEPHVRRDHRLPAVPSSGSGVTGPVTRGLSRSTTGYRAAQWSGCPRGGRASPQLDYRENRPFYEMMLRSPVAVGRAAPTSGFRRGGGSPGVAQRQARPQSRLNRDETRAMCSDRMQSMSD